jgi:Ca2+-binding RTX toxin-like protein
VIGAKVVDSQLVVKDNGPAYKFNLSAVKQIKVFAKEGADIVTIDANVFTPAYIDTGNGAGTLGDTVQSGSGNDTIVVNSAYTNAKGGKGNDTLINKVGISGLYGEDGNDVLKSPFSSGSSDSIYDGGAGADEIRYAETDSGTSGAGTQGLLFKGGKVGNYSLDALKNPFFNGPGQDGLNSVENITATNGNDYIYTGLYKAKVKAQGGHDQVYGGAFDDDLRGGSGNDALFGNGGNDYIEGNAGNDFLSGGGGSNALHGNDGDDVFYSKNGVQDFLAGGAGNDKATRDAIDILNSVEGNA